jgi:lysozyme family protein
MGFDRIVNRLISEYEGGYTEDAGGPTKYGISQRGNPDLTTRQIMDLTISQATERYRKKEWTIIQGESILPVSEHLASAVFDFADNSGSGTAVRYLQITLSDLGFRIRPDGLMGPATLEAIKNADKNILVSRLLAKRALFMSGLKNWEKNKGGWLIRLFSVGMFY